MIFYSLITYSQNHLSPTKRHEKEKKRRYNNRVMNIKHGTFTPLVFFVSGSFVKECSIFHKHMAQKIANKTGERYEEAISIITCTLSFLSQRSSSMCIRGSRLLQKFQLFDDFAIVCELNNFKVEDHSFKSVVFV